jgi:hypothetical protein
MPEHTISITIHADEQIRIEIKQASANKNKLLDRNDKTVYDWLTLLSSILLPFAMALFTIVIAMPENIEQRENSEHYLNIAGLRSEQDRFIAEQQRNMKPYFQII